MSVLRQVGASVEALASAGLEMKVFDSALFGVIALDLRQVKALFAAWRAAGATDLAAWLAADPARAMALAGAAPVVQANSRALALYGVETLEALQAGWLGLFSTEALPGCAGAFAGFWDGDNQFHGDILIQRRDGTRRDAELIGKLVLGCETDWSCATVALVDRTVEKEGQRRLTQSEAYARALFEQSPVTLWVQDYSGVKAMFERLRADGVTDLRSYFDGGEDRVIDCLSRVKIIDVNQQALTMYGARTKDELMSGLGSLFLPSTLKQMINEMIEMFAGQWRQQREMETGTLTGEVLDVVVRVSAVPGAEADWSRILVAVVDITARRKAESKLRYIGSHDELSGLRNRVFYVEALARLEAEGPFPVTVIIADLNRLKAVNDLFGHAAGDAMLRRVGEILRFAVTPPGEVARIGGDEFAVLLPGTDEQGGAWMIGQIEALIAQNNEVYRAGALSLSLGMATFRRGAGGEDTLDATVQRADFAMYASKRAFHARTPEEDRRRDYATDVAV